MGLKEQQCENHVNLTRATGHEKASLHQRYFLVGIFIIEQCASSILS